jgi:hypothetical protein
MSKPEKVELKELQTPFDELIAKEDFNVSYHHKELEGSKIRLDALLKAKDDYLSELKNKG